MKAFKLRQQVMSVVIPGTCCEPRSPPKTSKRCLVIFSGQDTDYSPRHAHGLPNQVFRSRLCPRAVCHGKASFVEKVLKPHRVMVVAPRITNDKVVPQCWHTRRRIFQARTIIIRRYCTDVKFIEYVFPTPNSNREQARVEAFLAFLASVGLKVGIPRRSRRKNEFSKDRPKATSLGNLQVKFSLCDYFVCEVVFALALDSYPTGWLLPKTKNVNSVLRATKPSV